MKKCFLMLVVIGSFLCGCGSNEKTPTKNLPPQIDTENNVMPAQQKVVEVCWLLVNLKNRFCFYGGKRCCFLLRVALPPAPPGVF